jgi:hypothetical protein
VVSVLDGRATRSTRHLVTTSGILATRAKCAWNGDQRWIVGIERDRETETEAGMGLFDVLVRRKRRAGGMRGPDPHATGYLTTWASTRRGVEGYLEPRTTMTDTTLVLIAYDGEWTRRRITEDGARQLGRRIGIPVYDVKLVGYPQRMRDYTARLAKQQKRDRA